MKSSDPPTGIKTYLTAAGVTLALVLISIVLSSPISRLESDALDAKFVLRRERSLDSNIVLIYLDDADISALGGWPLKRNYYALLINALQDLGAKVIGLDIFFEEPIPLYTEFDSLLASVASKSKKVVFPSYFQKMSPVKISHMEVGPEGDFGYEPKEEVHFLSGSELHLPFPTLVQAAKGIGHENLSNESKVMKIPLFLRSNKKVFPSLSFEMARLFHGVDQAAVSIRQNEAAYDANGTEYRVPLSPDGYLHLNYRGGLATLRKFRFVEFLQSYDSYRVGAEPSLPITGVKGKAVLVGVIAPGLSMFWTTPFAGNFPGIGIHATALDNIVTQDFLRVPSSFLQHLLSAILTFSIFLIGLQKKELLGLILAVGLLVLFVVINFLAFLFFSVSLPTAQPSLMMLIAFASALALRHRRMGRELLTAASDKEIVERILVEKERNLVELERELRRARQKAQQRTETAIQEEIKQYRQDIRMLSAQAGDFSAYPTSSQDAEQEREEFEGLVYTRSGKMGRIIDLLKKLAPSDANVFVFGESGTGKELIAHAIHNRSKRLEKPFVALNCGALTESLLESELFGHERGAFTGAVRDKPGRFELANGGSIFLDEITETSESFQVKLLRVLQSGEFERVGGTSTMKVDVRVLAATNKNIKEEIEQKRFREDLYYRLSVFTIELPSLRERRADIPFLVDCFLKAEGGALKLSSTVMDAFLRYDWKGNVRELESVIKRAAILARAESRNLIRIRDLPEEIAACLQKAVDLEEQILALLREKGFSRSAISETAEDLGGLNRGTVAEYFRGLSFKTFFEQEFDLARAASILAGTDNPEVRERLRKKIQEYLANVFSAVQTSKTLGEVKTTLAPKYKNLPQRYHFFLDQLIETNYKGVWKLPGND